MVPGTQISAMAGVHLTELMEPAGTLKDGCMPSGAQGTTWAYCLYDERLIHIHGFATAKIKPIHN